MRNKLAVFVGACVALFVALDIKGKSFAVFLGACIGIFAGFAVVGAVFVLAYIVERAHLLLR